MRSARSDGAALRGREAGSVTAEVAVTLPVVVLGLAVVLFAGSVAQAGVRCVDTARATGRAVARGDTVAAAVAAGEQVAGRPVSVEVSAGDGPAGPGEGGLVVVVVRVEVAAAPGPSWEGSQGWRLPVTCRVRAWQEPTG